MYVYKSTSQSNFKVPLPLRKIVATEDFVAAKAGRILGLEDDKFRRCGTVRGGFPSRPPSAAGKAYHPLKCGKSVSICAEVQNKNHAVGEVVKRHLMPKRRNIPAGDFSLSGEGQAERPAVRRPRPQP